jgi:hypothetical protein
MLLLCNLEVFQCTENRHPPSEISCLASIRNVVYIRISEQLCPHMHLYFTEN